MKKLILLIFFLYSTAFWAQNLSDYNFAVVKEIPTSSVKNQGNSGTCWSFATTSFIETELIRMGKGEFDLSEMYFVRYTYPLKAERFLRFHGKINFGEGGQAHDVMNIIRKYGFMPESAYSGLKNSAKKHDHSELAQILEASLTAVIKNNNISDNILPAINAVLDVYLGKVPEKFTYNNKNTDAISFCKESGFNPDDYVEITSYTHHPFYTKFILEIPDNWSHDTYYNLPLEEMMKVMYYAIENGYSIAWDGDVSEKSFMFKKGIAIVPENEADKKENSETTLPVEKNITQELRQQTFDNYSTGDDHLMHITGLVKDKNGKKYFITKNSWGEDSNELKGKIYMSEAYVRLQTVAIMVHKNAIPEDIRKKLKL